MKAAVYTRYGPPDVVQIVELEKPFPKDSEVLIQVRAASINPLDSGLMRGKPYTFRLLSGWTRPKVTRLGVDVAGRVEAVGKNVRQFKPGDEVFGLSLLYPNGSGVKSWLCQGSFAEYVCAAEANVVAKPGNITFEEAAAVPVAALSALQGLRDVAHLQAGQNILINGAAGGVGTYAVQIAKAFGAKVVGVCSTRNVEMVRGLGADCVLDYTREDFTKSAESFDVVFDCIANHPLSACLRVLKTQGIYVGVGGAGSRWMIGLMARPIAMLLMSPFVKQKLSLFLAKPSKPDLAALAGLLRDVKLRSAIDRRYSLNEVPQAIRYLQEKHARGKVVVLPANNN